MKNPMKNPEIKKEYIADENDNDSDFTDIDSD